MSARVGYKVDKVRLGQARVAAGLTQQELADAAGVHRVTLVKIEAGTRTVSLGVVERLAEALDRPRDYLLGEPEQVDEFELARERLQNAATKIVDGLEEASLVLDLMREVRTTRETAGRDEVLS